MPTPRRRRRRRHRNRNEGGWIRQSFDVLTHRSVVAALWLAAAAAMVAVTLALGDLGSATSPVTHPELARGLAVLFVVALCAMGGMLWKRWKGIGEPDLVEEASVEKQQSRLGGRFATVAAVLMVGGMAIVVGDWLAAHQHHPAGELVLPLGEQQESVEVQHAGRSLDVMLPLRTTAHYLDLQQGEEPRVWLQFSMPDRHIDNPPPDSDRLQGLGPGESLDVEGKRFVFTGLDKQRPQHRAIFTSPDEQTRDDSGVVGDEIQLSMDGPTYRIVQITDDMIDIHPAGVGLDRLQTQLLLLAQGYPLGAMGPAVQLENEEGQTFWVFDREDEQLDVGDAIGENIELKGIQQIPSPVLAVTSVRSMTPFAVGGVLFVIGWALLLGLPERVRRRRSEDQWAVWSLNQVDTGGDRGWFAGAMVAVAAAALGASFLVGATQAGVVAVAGLAAVVALPRSVDSPADLRALVAAGAVIGAAVVAAVVSMDGFIWDPSMNAQRLLWAAQIGCWIAMAAALVGAGVLAESRVRGGTTNGAVTMALAVWAAMAAVVTLALQRGGFGDNRFGLPLTDGDGPVTWSIPGVDAAAELQLPTVADGTELGVIALVVALLAVLGVIGTVVDKPRVALFGWIGSLVSSVVALVYIRLAGHADPVGPGGYEQYATRWLESRQLPGWLAEMGRFDADATMVDVAAMTPEIVAFSVAACLAVAMIGLVLMGQFQRAEEVVAQKANTDDLAGRDLFVRAVMFGLMGWFLGLSLSWELLGAGGVQAPGEWLGLAVIVASLGLLFLGWRFGPSKPAKFLRIYGPALALAFLLWIAGLGAAAGVSPGAAVPFL